MTGRQVVIPVFAVLAIAGCAEDVWRPLPNFPQHDIHLPSLRKVNDSTWAVQVRLGGSLQESKRTMVRCGPIMAEMWLADSSASTNGQWETETELTGWSRVDDTSATFARRMRDTCAIAREVTP